MSRERKLITVEYAKRLARAEEKNKFCRPLDAEAVRRMAEWMSAGLWHETDEAIMLDADGHLIHGLTRVAAVAQSGVEVMMWVETLNLRARS